MRLREKINRMAPEKQPDDWSESQNILVILAHPDDPEFFCGATLARWARAGHRIQYVLLTCGEKGRNAYNQQIPGDELCLLRQQEERAAAAVIGTQAVHFLDHEDGTLVPDMNLRLEVVRHIRQIKPDILVTCDPQNLFASYGLNHPDHRAAGQVVLDAVFPAAGNDLFFPSLLREGLQPHMPREVWVALTEQPNIILDISDTWPIKLRALKEHKSQIGDPAEFEERMRKRRTANSTDENPRFEEKFRRIVYS
jgi:LmbE family N-acetylglucosaminyl deacetylase